MFFQERPQGTGYNGGISIRKSYIHPYRPAKTLPAARRYATSPENKRKWDICRYTDSAGIVPKVPAFVIILQRIVVLLEHKVEQVFDRDGRAKVQVSHQDGERTLEAERLLAAVGRRPHFFDGLTLRQAVLKSSEADISK